MKMEIARGVVGGAQKVVVYGPEGIGKSTFASHFPDPLFIDTEGSTKNMDVARTPRPTSWSMLLEQVKYVKQNPECCKTLIIDTADWAEQLCLTEICAKHQVGGIEDFGWGKGYTYLVEEFGKLLNLMSELTENGIHAVVTAHAKMRKFEQPDEMGAYDRWELKLQKTTAPLLKEWADMVLFANYETFVVNVDGQGAQKGKNKAKGGRRVMYTAHHPCWDAKNRHGLDEKLSFDYEQISRFIEIQRKQPEEVVPGVDPEVPEIKTVSLATEDLYFYHPESESYWSVKKGEVIPDGGGAEQLTKEEYEKRSSVREMEEASCTDPKDWGLPPVPPGKEYLRPLWDLMAANMVTPADVQRAVEKKHYYSKGTPIENYDPNFVQGVLIGAWPKVMEMIEALQNEEIPF